MICYNTGTAFHLPSVAKLKEIPVEILEYLTNTGVICHVDLIIGGYINVGLPDIYSQSDLFTTAKFALGFTLSNICT